VTRNRGPTGKLSGIGLLVPFFGPRRGVGRIEEVTVGPNKVLGGERSSFQEERGGGKVTLWGIGRIKPISAARDHQDRGKNKESLSVFDFERASACPSKKENRRGKGKRSGDP